MRHAAGGYGDVIARAIRATRTGGADFYAFRANGPLAAPAEKPRHFFGVAIAWLDIGVVGDIRGNLGEFKPTPTTELVFGSVFSTTAWANQGCNRTGF